MRSDRNQFEAVIPNVVTLGWTYQAMRCRTIMILVERGSVTDEELRELLDVTPQDLREVMSKMADEGVMVALASSGTTTLFLSDRRGWADHVRRTAGFLIDDNGDWRHLFGRVQVTYLDPNCDYPEYDEAMARLSRE